jgi:hypothetical protein
MIFPHVNKVVLYVGMAEVFLPACFFTRKMFSTPFRLNHISYLCFLKRNLNKGVCDISLGIFWKIKFINYLSHFSFFINLSLYVCFLFFGIRLCMCVSTLFLYFIVIVFKLHICHYPGEWEAVSMPTIKEKYRVGWECRAISC